MGSSTTTINLTAPLEIVLPNGNIVRMRWDASEKGLRVSAEIADGHAAQELVVRPRSANGVILQVA